MCVYMHLVEAYGGVQENKRSNAHITCRIREVLKPQAVIGDPEIAFFLPFTCHVRCA